jgi:glycosyltransferase involved in cell wall biosynthesis
VSLPRTAYVLLWFPKASETFVFTEVVLLRERGLPLKVYTLYGVSRRHWSPEMRASDLQGVFRLGVRQLRRAHLDLAYWWVRRKRETLALLEAVLFAGPYGLEKTGENLWAVLCSFRLARSFQDEGIEHIHAPWASGPATAAWAASRLTGIPFSFTARAWDVDPPDGILGRKMEDARFVRSESRFNIEQLKGIAPRQAHKVVLTYNSTTWRAVGEAAVRMTPPYRILAVGRFVGKKGFDDLIAACGLLRDAGMDLRLNLVGDGPLKRRLVRLTRRLGLTRRVSFPGFVRHDELKAHFLSADIFVMPSVRHASGDRDGLPNVITEALLHRVPVIATALAGIPEIIEDGTTGLLVAQRAPAAIARAVETLVGDRAWALRLAEAGRSRALEQFDPERNTRRILRLYAASES